MKTEPYLILLIENNIVILENLTEFFELKGYKILATNNGLMGIELAEKHSPVLIICDAFMPVIDGKEVLRMLLNSNITNDIPFIFSSSISEIVNKNQALELGADDYIIKPFDLNTLLQMAQSWIKTGNHKHQSINANSAF